MIRNNVDVIAIAILLMAIAIYSHARRLMLIELNPQHRVVLANYISAKDLDDQLPILPPEPPLPPTPSVIFSR